jgi:hypothetical protein
LPLLVQQRDEEMGVPQTCAASRVSPSNTASGGVSSTS